jgi:SAM-dependent methyltransferase
MIRCVDGVSADGSPVEVYLALPAEPDLERIRVAIPERCSVLDLGAGVGRLANPLAVLGHRVVAVDDSPEMLAHIQGATPVLADVFTLDLGQRFDVVLVLSHLINSPSALRRMQLLDACRRHVHDEGNVIIQRHPATWVPSEGQGVIGDVTIRLHDVEQRGGYFSAATTYSVRGRSWTQRWEASIVGDAELARLAETCGFTLDDPLDDTGAWVSLSPSKPS